MAKRILQNIGYKQSTAHTEFMEKLADLADVDPQLTGMVELLKDLGSEATAANKAIGAQFVVNYAHNILKNPPTSGVRKLKGFEQAVQSIPGLSNRSRIYDLIIQEGTANVRVELKAWSTFPPGGNALDSAL